MADIEEILTLEQLEKDIFRGNVTPSNLRRTFGGQVAGQSLVSAVRTVEPEYLVHSLHGRPRDSGAPS
ncbi:Probable acyl-CoA thioesterase II (TesB2) [Mycobacteroides abscessus subsp. abscessus]|nr:Probable acyl-CoA thioesterase II (TesB2) [Mycobacteroides abscessus subsp. abscessus]